MSNSTYKVFLSIIFCLNITFSQSEHFVIADSTSYYVSDKDDSGNIHMILQNSNGYFYSRIDTNTITEGPTLIPLNIQEEENQIWKSPESMTVRDSVYVVWKAYCEVNSVGFSKIWIQQTNLEDLAGGMRIPLVESTSGCYFHSMDFLKDTTLAVVLRDLTGLKCTILSTQGNIITDPFYILHSDSTKTIYSSEILVFGDELLAVWGVIENGVHKLEGSKFDFSGNRITDYHNFSYEGALSLNNFELIQFENNTFATSWVGRHPNDRNSPDCFWIQYFNNDCSPIGTANQLSTFDYRWDDATNVTADTDKNGNLILSTASRGNDWFELLSYKAHNNINFNIYNNIKSNTPKSWPWSIKNYILNNVVLLIVQENNNGVFSLNGYQWELFDQTTKLEGGINAHNIQQRECLNYPNPFNSSTKISFTLNNTSDVTLTIYNMAGQEIKTIESQNLSPGTHNLTWNGTNINNETVSSGVYIYQLRVKDNQGNVFNNSAKMILLK